MLYPKWDEHMKKSKEISNDIHFRMTPSEWKFVNAKVTSGEYSKITELFREALRDFRRKHGAIEA